MEQEVQRLQQEVQRLQLKVQALHQRLTASEDGAAEYRVDITLLQNALGQANETIEALSKELNGAEEPQTEEPEATDPSS